VGIWRKDQVSMRQTGEIVIVLRSIEGRVTHEKNKL